MSKKMLNASIDSNLFYRLKLHVTRVKQAQGQATQEAIVEQAIKELLERDEKNFENLCDKMLEGEKNETSEPT